MSESNIIEFKNVSISHTEDTVLENIDLEIKHGEFIYIIGKVGSGKTSLLKTLYCDIPYTQGSIEVAGYFLQSIKEQEIPFLRRKIGIVFQDFQLLTDRNVFDNLKFVLLATGWKNKQEIKKRITEVLVKVKMNDFSDKMPLQLSGGEQQRIVIARALLNSPDIILADEPTGNLDPETSKELLELFFDLNKNGKTILMITHQYDLLTEYPARIIRCENKKVIEGNM